MMQEVALKARRMCFIKLIISPPGRHQNAEKAM